MVSRQIEEFQRPDAKVVKFNQLKVLKTRALNPKTGRLNTLLICLTCKKLFKKKCNLLDHLKIHTGLRPFKCHVCDFPFRQKGPLKKHLERKH